MSNFDNDKANRELITVINALRYKKNNKKAIVDAVGNFVDSFEGDVPSLDRISKKMCVSSRTFNRRMKCSGVTYREILAESKKRKAIELLSLPKIKISEISLRLGYSDASNFTKAFRKWFGCTPFTYRSRVSKVNKNWIDL